MHSPVLVIVNLVCPSVTHSSTYDHDFFTIW